MMLQPGPIHVPGGLEEGMEHWAGSLVPMAGGRAMADRAPPAACTWARVALTAVRRLPAVKRLGRCLPLVPAARTCRSYLPLVPAAHGGSPDPCWVTQPPGAHSPHL